MVKDIIAQLNDNCRRVQNYPIILSSLAKRTHIENNIAIKNKLKIIFIFIMIELNGLSTYLVFNLINDGLSTLSFMCSVLFMVVIFCFLHNSPPERQCR